MIMISGKKVKKRSSLCGLGLDQQKHTGSQEMEGGGGVDLSASILDLIKPRCSTWETKKKNRGATSTPNEAEKKQQQQLQLQPVLKKKKKNVSELTTLQEWILNSPILNIQFSSGRLIHPEIVSVDAINSVATDSSSDDDDNASIKSSTKSMDDDDDDNASIKSSTKMPPTKKKVRFMLPQVAHLFLMDSADGYYYSN